MSETEVRSGNCFTEYSKSGYKTVFTVTLTKPFERWELQMRNANIKGSRVGIFKERGHSTEVEFTGYAESKKFYMTYLKKQQKRFPEDLIKALS